MKQLIRYFIILGVCFNYGFNLYSQDFNPTGRYQLRHNIPSEAFRQNDSIIEFPIWSHDEFIELAKNKKVQITIVKADKSEQKIEGTWNKVDDKIEVKTEIGDFIFILVMIDKKPHLKLVDNKFKYYMKI